MIFDMVIALFIFFVVLPIAFAIICAILGFFGEIVADSFASRKAKPAAKATPDRWEEWYEKEDRHRQAGLWHP